MRVSSSERLSADSNSFVRMVVVVASERVWRPELVKRRPTQFQDVMMMIIGGVFDDDRVL